MSRLESFCEVMNKGAKVLCKRLSAAADSGELIDIHRLFCDLAMVRQELAMQACEICAGILSAGCC